MQTISGGLNTEITDGSQQVKGRVTVTWADARHMENLSYISSEELYKDQTIRLGAKHYYRCDELSGTVLNNLGSARKAGTRNGSPSQIGGAIDDANKAVDLNGTSQYLTVTHDSFTSVAASSDRTWEIWIRPDNVTSQRVLFAKQNASAISNPYTFKITSAGEIAVRFGDGVTEAVVTSSGAGLVVSTWYLITIVKDGTNITIYKNGVQIGSGSVSGQTISDANLSVRIGANQDGTDFYDGRIDEIGFYTYAMTPMQVLCRYRTGAVSVTSVNSPALFGPEQAFNNIKEETLPIAVLNATDEQGKSITANGRYYVAEATPSGSYEYGHKSKRASNGSSTFSIKATLAYEFDQRPANYIGIHNSYSNARFKQYEVFYKNTSDTWVSVGVDQFADGEVYKEHSIGTTAGLTRDIKGIRLEITNTFDPSQYITIHEFEPIYRSIHTADGDSQSLKDLDVSRDIVSLEVQKVKEEFESTVPLGTTAANTFSIVLDNTGRKYNPYLATGYGPYVRKDVQVKVELGWNVSGTYEYVTQGTFWVDSWEVGSDSMTLTGQGRDALKDSQEQSLDNGVLFTDVSAGEAVTRLARMSGHPNRLTKCIRPYAEQVKLDRPYCYYRLNDFGPRTTITNWWTRWWKRSSTTYMDIDTSLVPDLEEEASTLNMTDKVIGGQSDYYNGRMETWLVPGFSEVYTLYANVDDGVRVYLDDWLMIDQWRVGPATEYSAATDAAGGPGALVAGKRYKLVVEYMQHTGPMKLELRYSSASVVKSIIPHGVVEYFLRAEDSMGRLAGKYYNGATSQVTSLITDSSDKAATFDGVNDKIQVENFSPGITTALTFEAWVNTNNAAAEQRVFTIVNGSGSMGLRLTGGGKANLFTRDAADTVTQSCTGATTISVGQAVHIVGTQDANGMKIYFNGVLDNSNATGTFHGTIGSTLYIGSSASSSLLWDGELDEIAIYPRALSAEEVQTHYKAGRATELRKFSYLYSKDQTIWDTMIEWATADLGIFYLNEMNEFYYQNGNEYYDTILDRHQTVQYTMADNTNIIAASLPVQVQTNKVIVKVNPVTLINSARQQIWRADQNESLAVTSLSEDIDLTETDFLCRSTDKPAWKTSGYFKINDEICKYTSTTESSFGGITRGMFGTTVSTHTTGDKIREVRVYEIEYSNYPALQVFDPFITAMDEEAKVDIESWIHTPFKAQLILSADKDNTAVDEVILLEGTHPVTELNYYFAIAGVALAETAASEQITEQVTTNSSNIRKYKIKDLTIDNKFIQDVTIAQQIADFVILHYQNPVPILNIDTMGIPHLQLGDRVKISSLAQLNIVDKEYWISEISISYDGGVAQQMVLREVS